MQFIRSDLLDRFFDRFFDLVISIYSAHELNCHARTTPKADDCSFRSFYCACDDLIPRVTTNELVVKIRSFTFIPYVAKYNYLSKRLTGNWHVSFISNENFISLDILIQRGRPETIKRQIIVVVGWSTCGIAMFAFVIWWWLRPRAGKKTRREEERKRDVTPWEPTVPFHGFCSVKVIRYHNESALLALRRYPCSRSARDRELIDRGHLFGTTALSRVCRSFVQAITQSQSASKVNTCDIFHLEELWQRQNVANKLDVRKKRSIL